MNDADLHQLLGAYLLGGLEPHDAAAFDHHLTVCSECRQELDELASLPALLDAVPVAEAIALAAVASGSQPVPAIASAEAPRQLLDQLAARRRSARRRWLAALGGAAAAALALGVLAGPSLIQPDRPDASYSVESGAGLQFSVGLVKKTWGTELAVEGGSLPVEGTVSLWVKDRDGVEDRAFAWTATPSGKVRITGATPVQLTSIASVEMRDSEQQTLAVISVPQG